MKKGNRIIGAVPVLEQECCYATPLELDKEGWGCEKLSRHCDKTSGSLSLSQGLPNLDLVVFLAANQSNFSLLGFSHYFWLTMR